MKISTLAPPDSLHVEAATGWCELDALDEAQAELDKVSSDLRNHPAVLEVRWLVCSKLNKWAEARQIADTMMEYVQARSNTSACAGMNRLTEMAWTVRQLAAKLYSGQARVYELACMCCVLGRLDSAKMLLENAIGVGGDSVRRRALKDRHLKPLWNALRKWPLGKRGNR